MACCAAIARSTSSSTAPARRGLAALADRDRALARTLVATVLRRLGTLRHLLGFFLERGLPAAAPRVETALLLGAAQILWLEVPDHAAVDLSVRLRARGPTGRPLCRAGQCGAPPSRPRWRTAAARPRYGRARYAGLADAALDACLRRRPARTIAIANGAGAGARPDGEGRSAHWASLLGGRVLPTGSVRAVVHGPVTQLPGFAEGAWWVQDAAAALPARLFGDLRGKTVADLCAAPGGKTAQLAAAGAQVIAVDRGAGAARAAAAKSRPAWPRGRDRRRRRGGMAGRAVRRRPARRALFVDRHHPPPSRYSLAQAARPTSKSSRPCSAVCSPARSS